MDLLTWKDVLIKEKKLKYFQNIMYFLSKELKKGIIIYPKQNEIFNAFRFTELHCVKVIILGQDPYHSLNQANGFAFSVQPKVPIPPSLRNIYKELKNNIPEFMMPNHGYLKSWAKQGVLLLNTILTVESGKARSHSGIGWETFTDRIITILNNYRKGLIFLLWGTNAKNKRHLIDIKRHYVLMTSHPSPFSANNGFFGCNHFFQVNLILEKQKKKKIDWQPYVLEQDNFCKKN